MEMLPLLSSFFLGLILTTLCKNFSEKTGTFVDIAGGDILKIHKKQISILGGLAMIVSIFLGFVFLPQKFLTEIIALILGFLPVFLLGFWDDLKWKHVSTSKPFLKFLFLILSVLVSAAILFFAEISFNFFPLPAVSILLTSIYIFVVINSINYQDGIDGLAGGLVLISLIGFIILSLFFNNNFTLIISLIFSGAVLSFLIFNFPPAKIFMGDSGAYSLGFALTVLAIFFSKPYNIYSVLSPVFIMGLPIFDGVFSNIRRIFSGKSIFFGDRKHFYDKLLKRFSIKKTLFISYSLQILSVIIGLIIYFHV